VTPTPAALQPRPSSRRDPEGITEAGPGRLALEPGQQYRFTFDMGACIGCHSCEVACAEQNGLPVEVSWRKVGEIEGGEHPHTKRFHLSLACNHCLEPACLSGCPTSAYTKLSNGIVAHDADSCIGCQYCTWNCPYSVPVFQPDRKIVTKCDMCSPRLEGGFTSACVDACPTHAIGIEKVDVATWRLDHSNGNAPNLPSSDLTLSTTRIVLPANLPADTFTPNQHHLVPEDAHWPLIFLTLLTQLSVGAMATAVGFRRTGHGSTAGTLIAAAAGGLALAASLFHLGRPAVAWKALRNLRTSWLSREVLAFGLYAPLAMATALVPSLGTVAVAVGVIGVLTSGRLYLVPGRPAWNSRVTLLDFLLTAAAIGPPLALLAIDQPSAVTVWTTMVAVSGLVLLTFANLGRLWLAGTNQTRGTVRLTLHRFRMLTALRATLAVGVLIGGAFSLGHSGGQMMVGAMAAATLMSSGIGRYLFYVTVVPASMPGSSFRGAR